MKPVLAILMLAALAAPAAAESGIQGPVAGFVADTGLRAIRPINGLPGSSVLGEALPLGFAVRHAAISPGLDFAAAISDDDGAFYLVRGLKQAAPQVTAVEGVPAGISRIVLNGDAALLYSPAEGRLQVLSGLPEKPELSPPVDAPPGEVTALALAPGGTRFAVGVSGAVYLYSGEAFTLLASAPGISALAFRAGGEDVVYASREINQVVEVSGAGGGSAVLAGEPEGVSAPVGLLSIDGGRELWIANAGSSSALVLDAAAPGAPAVVPLAAPPTHCEALDGKSMLLLNHAGGGPLILADWTARRAYFVPAEVAP